ncbi:uncharacterized protein HKW66_Vig0040870 [Vigna angularis]|uniref:Secondary thiamine-phosphate synthase enzyme n=1 Tax=Phaseolus angularis TaxID=3914 RepID=A0A8T0LGR1_PHAAN|nr:uncharacterized protein HKW66_Vig0040870 [Vigna angularis]
MGKRGMYPCNLLLHNPPASVRGFKTEKHQNDDASLIVQWPDDMPAHIKSSMFGCALTIPITNGKLNMGTWQGIWLCEHRDHPTSRRVVVTLNGI